MFERFDEYFDYSDGGALYVADCGDGTYDSVGILWLDGGYDELHYFAFKMNVAHGDEVDGILVTDPYLAADAFSHATDPYVSEEIGWFATMDEAVQAVEDYVAINQ